MSPSLIFVQSPLDRAQAAKNKGNKYFKAGKYENAIQCYTEAIAVCPLEQKTDLSTFYQNRAAAYEQLVSIYSSRFTVCTLSAVAPPVWLMCNCNTWTIG